jgi:flagellar basal body-associated protein FliL
MNIIIIVTVIVILILSAAAAAAARSAGFSQCVRTELLLIAKSSPRKNQRSKEPKPSTASRPGCLEPHAIDAVREDVAPKPKKESQKERKAMAATCHHPAAHPPAPPAAR